MGDSQVSPFKATVLNGRRALVTGGGSGIGFEIARQLGLHGAQVVIMGRRKEVLDEAVQAMVKEGIQAAAFQGDVRNPEDAGLDTLVNGAAGNFLANASELAPKVLTFPFIEEGFKTVMEIDAGGVFNLCHAYQVHASAAKAAIDSITRSLALEWGAHKIRVAGIAPGLTKLGGPGAAEAIAETILPMVPLGRLGSKFDIAMTAVFLCSSAATYLSGDTLIVDGASYLYREQLLPPEIVAEFSQKMEKKAKAAPKSKL